MIIGRRSKVTKQSFSTKGWDKVCKITTLSILLALNLALKPTKHTLVGVYGHLF